MDADIAQSVERILGKDEVSGSNPDISSIKEKARVNPLLFLLYSCLPDAEPENAKAFYYFALWNILAKTKCRRKIVQQSGYQLIL